MKVRCDFAVIPSPKTSLPLDPEINIEILIWTQMTPSAFPSGTIVV